MSCGATMRRASSPHPPCGVHRRLATLVGIALAAPCASCDDEPAVAPETPAKQFVLEDVRIDDKHEDGSTWQGTAKRADGDLSSHALTEPHLVITTADAPPRRWEVRAPRGTVSFDDRRGTFDEVVITDEAGGVLTAGRAVIEGSEERIVAEGPLHFVTPELSLRAPRGTVSMRDGTAHIEGPVIGRYRPR